jgi:hypothetical protein
MTDLYHDGGQPQFTSFDDEVSGYGVQMSETHMVALVVIPRAWKMDK